MVFAIHWQESAMDLHVFPIPIPPPASLPVQRSLWVFPVHQPWARVSCIQPGLVICFTLDSILVSMLFSQNIPPSPSPTESEFPHLSKKSIYFISLAALGPSCSMWPLSYNTWDLVPWPGITPRLPALGTQNFSHWITREVSPYLLKRKQSTVMKLSWTFETSFISVFFI